MKTVSFLPISLLPLTTAALLALTLCGCATGDGPNPSPRQPRWHKVALFVKAQGLTRPAHPGDPPTHICAPFSTGKITVKAPGLGQWICEMPGAGMDKLCTFNLPIGTRVILTATPTAPSQFVDFTGDVSSTSSTIILTLTAHKMIIAEFCAPQPSKAAPEKILKRNQPNRED